MADVVSRLTTALSDRYRVTRELGAGGMATVYLAHDLRHERDVAIKVLHPDLGEALGADRFLAEIKTTAKLQHPHILPLLDSGAAGGLLYYVMPYITGETVRARLERERQLPVDDALRIARAVGDALQYAHEQGIIHRDIKPENILLQGGHALVADFGIALAVQQAGGQRMTQTGLSLGTPQYMSPEQAMGERTIDARSDQYVLAAVLYELFAGEPPFTGATVQAVIAKVISAEPESLTLVRKAVTPAVDAAVRRALAKLPADRFASVAAFLAALATAETPAAAGPPATATVREGTNPRSRGPAVTVAGSLAAVLGLTAGWGLWGAARAGGPAADMATLTRVQATFTGVAGLPALSADGDVLAYVERRCAQPSHDGHQNEFAMGVDAVPCVDRVLVQDTGSTSPVTVLRGVREVQDVRWTPSGTALVLAAALDSVSQGTYVLPRLGGIPRRVGPMGFVDVHARGDTALVLPGTAEFQSAPYALVVVLATGQVADSVRMPSHYLTGIAWSPDGGHIATTDARGRVYVVDRANGRADSIAAATRQHLRWTPAGEALLFFQPAAGRDDDFLRVAVDRAGHFVGAPVPIAPRAQMVFRGSFDVARTSGLVAVITGNATGDLHTFPVRLGERTTSRQVTSGTSWYSYPTIAPNGRAIYYLSGNGNGDNLFRVATDTPEPVEEALTTGNGAGVSIYSLVSPDGRRVIFQRYLGDSLRTLDVNVEGQPAVSTSPLGADGSWRPGLFPFGTDGVAGVSADLRALLVVEGRGRPVRRVAAPDSFLIMATALSPDATRMAVELYGPRETLFGVTPIDRWDFMVLERVPGPAIGTSLSWRDDGFVYYGDFDTALRMPVLRRLDPRAPIAGRARVALTLPERCKVPSAVVAARAPVGTCLVEDYRGDVYLWRLDGVTR
ncbi:protein kinase [Gemmatimonas sp.]|jgi:Tol biopolymer transport system component|uniref:protein kinase domain-containing protein n=1 Tax=Gemmatimonas sp. TaxID=1962908 RepID=UPI0037C191C0